MALADRLDRARIRFEATLIDHALITLDPVGFSDDTFDTTTGLWTRPTDDQGLVYDGPCSLKNLTGVVSDDDGVDTVVSEWVGKIMLLSSAGVTEGAIMVVDASRDPGAVGRKFKVDEVIAGTFKVSRRLRLSSLLASPRQWSDR